jgi:hypothetical protein
MSLINISNLAGSELLTDSESFLTELDATDSSQVFGGSKGKGGYCGYSGSKGKGGYGGSKGKGGYGGCYGGGYGYGYGGCH